MTISVQEFLKDKGGKTERALDDYIESWDSASQTLGEAVRYSLFAGGKRLRPALALGAAELIRGDDTPALPAACALEMIHTYSLIHDDLPAMDNDDLRRGRPTCHKVYGEATAILAGDTLLTMAFDIAAGAGSLEVIHVIACAAGAAGMAGGQQLDMEAENRALTLEELSRIHAAKTGALIRASLHAGAILAGADEVQRDALIQYGVSLGWAFQITDDILDVVGSEADTGKPTGSDASSLKTTYPSLIGIDESRRLAAQAADQANQALAPFDGRADIFRALARFVVDRDR